MSSDVKSDLQPVTVLAPAPSMTRGQASHISAIDATSSTFAYPSGLAAIVRDIENPAHMIACNRHTVAVTAVRIAPNGNFVASGDKDGNIIVWLNRPDTAEKYRGKVLNGAVRDIAWTKDSERLCVVGEGRGDFGVAISITGSSLGEITGHAKDIVSCDFRKERPYKIFTGGADTKVGFYEGPPFKFTHSVPSTFKNAVTCVRVSPDHTTVACVSGGNEIVLLDAVTGKQLRAITTDHQGTIYSVAWSADGAQLATASADKSVKIFKSETGECVSTASFGKSISAMQEAVFFTSAGVVSVSLNGSINVVGGPIPRRWYGHQKGVVGLFFDAATNSVLSFGNDGAILRWPAGAPGSAEPAQSELDNVATVTFAPALNNKYVFTCGSEVSTYDASTNAVAPFSKDGGSATAVAATAAGKVFLLSKSSIVVLGSAGAKEFEEKWPQFDGSAVAAFGNTVACGGDKTVRLVEVNSASGAAVVKGEFKGQHGATVTALAFSPDGSRIASGDSSKSIFVWEAAAPHTVLHANLSFHTLRITSLVFEANEVLISGSVDSSIIVWKLDQKKRKMQDAAHRGGVSVVALGAHGEILSTGGDYCIRRWAIKE